MKLLDDLNRRKKLRKVLDDLSDDVENIESIDDMKSFIKKLVDELKEII